MRKILTFLLCLAFCACQGVALAAVSTTDIKTVSKTVRKVSVSYPSLVTGSSAVVSKVNSAIGKTTDNLVAEAATLGGGTINYEVHKMDATLISMTMTMTPKQGVEETVGLTFDRATGEKRPLSFYYSDDELIRRSADGLKYLYDINPKKGTAKPDEYYVDEDNNVIGIYHAGAVLDKTEGEIEINLSVADPVVVETPVTPPPSYTGDGIKGTITGTEVRMRDAAGLDSNILGYFEKGEVVKVNSNSVVNGRKWFNVTRTDGATGWIAADYCSVEGESTVPVAATTAKKGRIVGTDVRMRSDPNLNGDVLEYFANGEEVTILDAASGSDMDWTKVRRSNGEEGWVASAYCKEI